MKNSKIAVIGCGNIGLSIVNGLLKESTTKPSYITASKRKINDISDLKSKGVQITSNNIKAVKESDILILAVKPYNATDVLEQIKKELKPGKHILISLVTGLTIDSIKEIIQKPVPVFRVMPNTSSVVNQSVNCFSHKQEKQDSVATVKTLFEKLGIAVEIDEELMEAATILGACGIAYVLRFIRAMIQGGIQIGFDSKVASVIVNQVVKGAAQLLINNNAHPENEIDKVTTPKGCTIVGLNEMEHNGFSSSLIKGIIASFEKIEKD